MNISTILTAIITSTVIASLITDTFLIIKTNIDYKNKFYKIILNKRIESYVKIEEILQLFSIAIPDYNDNKFYHYIFSENDNTNHIKFYQIINKLNKANIWINKNIYSGVTELNENKIDFENIEYGKNHYIELGYIHDIILINAKQDILKLYDIKKF